MADDNVDKKMAALAKLRAMRAAGGAKPIRPGDGQAATGEGGGKAEALRKFMANRQGGAGGGGAGGGKLRELIKARQQGGGGGMGAGLGGGGLGGGAGGGLRDRLAGGGGGEGGGKRALLKKIIENRKAGGMGAGAAAEDEPSTAKSAAEQREMLRERIKKMQAKLDQMDIDAMDDDLDAPDAT